MQIKNHAPTNQREMFWANAATKPKVAVLILIRSRIFAISIRCGILQCIVQKSVYRNFITYHKLRLFWDVVRRLEWLFFAIKIPEKCKIAENKNMRNKTIWSMYPDFIFNFIRIWKTEREKKARIWCKMVMVMVYEGEPLKLWWLNMTERIKVRQNHWCQLYSRWRGIYTKIATKTVDSSKWEKGCGRSSNSISNSDDGGGGR